MELVDALNRFRPCNEQEETDKNQILSLLSGGQDLYTRDNPVAHLTASSWVVSPDRKQVLLIYHNLYRSWAWMGGHADGERDLCRVALRETREESGLQDLTLVSPDIFSLESLTVDGHEKRGKFVSSHLHLNVTYLLEADPRQPIRVKPDENSGVAWFPVEEGNAGLSSSSCSIFSTTTYSPFDSTSISPARRCIAHVQPFCGT